MRPARISASLHRDRTDRNPHFLGDPHRRRSPYKIKKPVDFGFLDFSTLERRRHFCEEEVRLNRRFAESLYVDVVPITMVDGAASFCGAGEAFEYAVRMRQFRRRAQLDRLLEAGKLPTEELGAFGDTLAAVHATLPRVAAAAKFGTAAAVLDPVAENFLQVRQSLFSSLAGIEVEELEAWSNARHAELTPTIEQRRRDGFVRECHGDLHLSNLVRLDDGIHAFDCIEFSDALRWIDVISDAAFLVMDCEVRNRSDLAHAFLDSILEHSGDYRGVALLGFYLVYRSMVRAKVAALQAKKADDADCCDDSTRTSTSRANARCCALRMRADVRRLRVRQVVDRGAARAASAGCAHPLRHRTQAVGAARAAGAYPSGIDSVCTRPIAAMCCTAICWIAPKHSRRAASGRSSTRRF